MKTILVSLAALAILAAPALAGVKSVEVQTASLADDAIDTLYVSIADFRIDDAGAFQGGIANLENVAADSVQIGLDVGVLGYKAGGRLGGAWTEVYSVANDGTNLDKNEVKAITFDVGALYGDYIRLRIKNVSGAALAANVKVSYYADP